MKTPGGTKCRSGNATITGKYTLTDPLPDHVAQTRCRHPAYCNRGRRLFCAEKATMRADTSRLITDSYHTANAIYTRWAARLSH